MKILHGSNMTKNYNSDSAKMITPISIDEVGFFNLKQYSMYNNVSEIQVSYKTENTIDFKIESSRETFSLVVNKWESDLIEMQEEVKILLLNRSNKVLGIYSLAKGGIASCVVDVRIILAVALKAMATGIILIHNHPSGNLNPSADDKKITEQLNASCKLLGISLLDHLIITNLDYFSFADEGML